VVGVAALLGVLVQAAPAGATVTHAAKTTKAAKKTKYQLNSVGADVTFCVSSAIDATFKTTESKTTGNVADDTPPYLNENIGCENPTPPSYTVPADSVHPAITYSATNPPPSSSGAGITAFIDDNGAGNIAFARSSSGRKSTYPSNLEFWAFGLDGVSWDTFSVNTSAPTNLTTTQLEGIYNCTYTNWDQVGGKNAAISLFYPVATSGTASFFAQEFLGGTIPTSTPSCPITFVPQNDATQVPTADQATSIEPYDYANYYSQTSDLYGTGGDLAAGTVLGKVNSTAVTAKTINEAAAFANISGDACTNAPIKNEFCASRYLYNVTWQELPAAYYSATIALIGVPSSGTAAKTSVCDDTYSKDLTTYGFVALKKETTGQSTSSDPVPGSSYCRQF
jgi:phosphate transport system substrate-binding protein